MIDASYIKSYETTLVRVKHTIKFQESDMAGNILDTLKRVPYKAKLIDAIDWYGGDNEHPYVELIFQEEIEKKD